MKTDLVSKWRIWCCCRGRGGRSEIEVMVVWQIQHMWSGFYVGLCLHSHFHIYFPFWNFHFQIAFPTLHFNRRCCCIERILLHHCFYSGNKGSHSSDNSQTISAVRTNCVASFRFTSELEVYLPTEVTSASEYFITARLQFRPYSLIRCRNGYNTGHASMHTEY